MADIELVIKIPEEVKHKVYAYGLSLCPSDKEQLIHAVMKGTPLPERHGRLIDADALTEKAPEIKEYLDVLAPTIIEGSDSE